MRAKMCSQTRVKVKKRVSDNELHLSDPQNNKMVDITAM